MEKFYFLPILFALLVVNQNFAQVGINTTEPNPSAELDVASTQRGFLPPRMSSNDRDAINNPAAGLMIYNTDDNNIQYFNGSAWFEINANVIASTSACGGLIEFTDPRDGQTYALATIGDQCWFAENLNYTPTAGSSWCYDDNSANCDIYGRLYDWSTLMNGASSSNTNPSGVQGLCPTGWHVPSDSEWTQLTDFLGGELLAAGEMKTTTGWVEPNVSSNSSGFSALPGGGRSFNTSSFLFIGETAVFWSSTETSSDITLAIVRLLNNFLSTVQVYNYTKFDGFSCRCVRD